MQQKNENNDKERIYQPSNFKQWLTLKEQQNKKDQRSIQDEQKLKLQRQNLINNAALSFLTQYRELFTEKKQRSVPLEKIPEYSSSEGVSQLQQLQEQLKLSKLSESFSSSESDLSLYTFHPDHEDKFIQKQFESQEDQKYRTISKIELQKTQNNINFKQKGQRNNLDGKKLKRLKRNRLKKLKGLSDKNKQTKTVKKLQKMIEKMGIKQFKLNQQQQLGIENKKQVQKKLQSFLPNSFSSDSSKYYESDSDQDFVSIKRKIGSKPKELESKQKLGKNKEARIITQDHSWD